MGGATDDVSGLFLIGHPRQLDLDGVALTGNVRLGDPQCVDPLADRRHGLVQQFLIDLPLTGGGQEVGADPALQVKTQAGRQVGNCDPGPHGNQEHQEGDEQSGQASL